MMSYRENLHKCHEYVRALEEEKRKIQMFQKELPLCLEIVTQTIDSCKQQLSGTMTATTTTTTTDCSEQTTSDALVLEEFIPINNSLAPDSTYRDREEEEEEDKSMDVSKKSDWLRSAQLWNQSPDPPTKEAAQQEGEGEKNSRLQVRKVSVVEVTQTEIVTPEAPAGSSCSTAERSGSKKEGLARKSRRCWSPELHRRFLNALQQLGGPHVATPKQIRELMKVDGLTNDEVKSHLQKYRLHTTRRPTTTTSQPNSTQAAPQFMVVGGIWVQQSNDSSSREGVTTPGAGHQADIDNSSSKTGGLRCNSSSPATSSSARAPTASPAC